MLKKTSLTLFMTMSLVMSSYGEDWEKVGDVNSKFEGIVKNFEKQPAVREKDVLEAFQTFDYEVFVDTESIKKVADDERSAQHKVVFVEEHKLAGTDKEFKYVLAELSFHCALDAIWFINGAVYDKNGEHLRDAQTLYVAVALSKLSRDSLERLLWEKVCLHKKLK